MLQREKLVKKLWNVHNHGYGGSQPHSVILEHPSIHVHKMTQWPVVPNSLAKILYLFMLLLKPIVQFVMLLWFLCVKIPAPDVYIVQSYGYLGSIEPDKVVLEKAHSISDAAIVSEIDRTMKRYTDNLLHAIDGLSARLSQLESRTRRLEHSVDDLKVSIGNNHGGTNGKMRQMENILREVSLAITNSCCTLTVQKDITEFWIVIDI